MPELSKNSWGCDFIIDICEPLHLERRNNTHGAQSAFQLLEDRLQERLLSAGQAVRRVDGVAGRFRCASATPSRTTSSTTATIGWWFYSIQSARFGIVDHERRHALCCSRSCNCSVVHTKPVVAVPSLSRRLSCIGIYTRCFGLFAVIMFLMLIFTVHGERVPVRFDLISALTSPRLSGTGVDRDCSHHDTCVQVGYQTPISVWRAPLLAM